MQAAKIEGKTPADGGGRLDIKWLETGKQAPAKYTRGLARVHSGNRKHSILYEAENNLTRDIDTNKINRRAEGGCWSLAVPEHAKRCQTHQPMEGGNVAPTVDLLNLRAQLP